MSMTQTQVQNVPELRFPEFSGEWLQDSLGGFFTFKNGVNADKSAYGKGHKFINVLDIISDHPITSENIIGSVTITDKEFEKNKVVYGDILFQRSSETREEVGQSNVYLDRDNPATFGGFVIRGHPRKDFNSEYFHSLLKTMKVRKDMTSRSGGSTRYNVGQESLSQTSVNLAPTLPEQQKIASFLSSVDLKIAQIGKKKALLEQYKKGMMQKLFSQELRFKDAQGNDFPDWEEKRLGEVTTSFSGGTPSSSNRAYYSGDIPFIGSGNIGANSVNQFITKDALSNSSAKMVKKGDMLYALYGATSGEVAISKINGAINQAILCVRSNEVLEYLFHYLLFKKGRILATFLQGGQGNLSAQIIKALKVDLPSKPEQQKNADFLSSIDRKIDLVSTELTRAQTFKKGLLQQMFI